MTDYLITGLKKKKKSFIEKELEFKKFKEVHEAIQSALKELKKRLCLNILSCNPNNQEKDWKCRNCMAIEEVFGGIEE